MFITFEGIDGCGKSTQIALLKQTLENKGLKVVNLREPGGTEVSEKIRNILLESRNNISPIAELLLFEAARALLTEQVIIPESRNGKIILSDRFYDSTTAYQGYGRGLDIAQINELNRIATISFKPDITFYLHIPLEVSKNRSRHKNHDRMELAGDDFFLRVIHGFNEIARAEPERVKIIDASGSVEHTHNIICNYVGQRLKS